MGVNYIIPDRPMKTGAAVVYNQKDCIGVSILYTKIIEAINFKIGEKGQNEDLVIA